MSRKKVRRALCDFVGVKDGEDREFWSNVSERVRNITHHITAPRRIISDSHAAVLASDVSK